MMTCSNCYEIFTNRSFNVLGGLPDYDVPEFKLPAVRIGSTSSKADSVIWIVFQHVTAAKGNFIPT